ncbi:MAG: T9SS type A sorting domain-containing protein [Bacteroidota bacterium]|nr:T9SS type A sorting domain-containing protein [Bacteroidota bacterium]
MKKTLLLLLFAINACGQTFTFDPGQFISRNGNQQEKLVSAAVNSSGDLYFLANSVRNKIDERLCIIVKCNNQGDTLWSRTFNFNNTLNEFATDLVIDHNDDIIIGGNVDPSVNVSPGLEKANFVAKYNSNGVLLAADTFNNGKTYNHLHSLAVDSNNNVFVAASSFNSLANIDILVYKLNTNLQRQWTESYDNAFNKNDEPVKIMCNADNDVFLVGKTYSSSTNRDLLLQKYDTNGNLVWTLNYDYQTQGFIENPTHAFLNDSCVYISSIYYDNTSLDKNLITKISKNGTYSKSTVFRALVGDDISNANFKCKDDHLAVSSYFYVDSSAVSMLDTSLTIKYIKRFKGNALPSLSGSWQYAEGLTFNADKRVLASFSFSDSITVSGVVYPKKYCQLALLDSLGNVIYSKIDNSYRGTRYSQLLFNDNKNYLLGEAEEGGNGAIDVYVNTLNAGDGTLQSQNTFDNPERGGSNDMTLEQVKLSTGDFVLANQHSNSSQFYYTLDVINASRQTLYSYLDRDSLAYSDTLFFLGKDALDNIYTASYRTYGDTLSGGTATRRFIKIAKYNSTLQLQWRKSISLGILNKPKPRATVSSAGNMFISTYIENLDTLQLLKYSDQGVFQWNVSAVKSPYTSVVNKGLLCGDESSVFLYGSFTRTSPSYQNYGVLKFDAVSGAFLLGSNFTDAIGSGTDVMNHAIINNGKIVGTGKYGYSNQFSIAIDTSNLSQLWLDNYKFNAAGFSGGKSVFSYLNDVFVMGYYTDNANSYLKHILLTRFSASGTKLWTKNYLSYSFNMYPYDRFGCAAANGTDVVLATASGYSPADTRMEFLRYNFTNGNLLSSINWYLPLSNSSSDGIVYNLSENGSNYLATGKVYTMEYWGIGSMKYFDMFYGELGYPSAIGIYEVELVERNMICYPNPGTDELNLLVLNSSSGNFKIEIYNSMGQMVKTNDIPASATLVKIPANDLASGIYFIKVINSETEYSLKWIKQN